MTKTETGSSPRVRGTDIHHAESIQCGRIIPACAGNSSEQTRMAWEGSDHPRVCGEQASWLVSVVPSGGSSPRVRGTERPAD